MADPQAQTPDEFDSLMNSLEPAKPAEGAQPATPIANPAANPPGTQPPVGFLGKAWQATKDTVNAISGGILRAPGTAVGSALDTAEDIQRGALKVAGTGINELFPGQQSIGDYLIQTSSLDRGNYAKRLGMKDTAWGRAGYSSLNQGVADLGSFILGAEGISEARLIAALPKVLKVATSFGGAAFITQDPNAERLSSVLSNLGVHSEFTDWLANSDPSQDGRLEGRVKNALEGSLTGAALDGAFKGLKYLKSLYMGNVDGLDKMAAEVAAKRIIPKDAQPKPTEVVRDGGTVKVGSQVIAEFPDEKAYKAILSDTPESASALMPSVDGPDRAAGLLKQMATDIQGVRPVGASKDFPVDHVVKSDEQLYADARQMLGSDVGLDGSTAMRLVQQLSADLTNKDAAIIAIKTGWRKVAADMDTFANRGIDAIPEEELPAVKQAIHNVMSMSGYFANVRSQGGRILRSMGLADLPTYLAKDGKASLAETADAPAVALPVTRQDMGDWMEMWRSLANDPSARQNFVQGLQVLPSQWKYLRTSFANWFTASVLSGAPSLMMNTVGPAMIGALHTTEKTLGGFAASVFASDPARRAELRATSALATRAYMQTIGDIPTVLQYAKQAFLSNRGLIGGGGGTVADILQAHGPITPAMIRAAGMQDGPTWGYSLGNLINFLPRQFQRINTGLDEFAKRLSYNGEQRLAAQVEASQQGLSGEAFNNYVREKMLASIDEVGGAVDDTALRQAERTTFTGSLSNPYYPNLSRFALATNNMRREFPEFRYIAPVFNVPANSVGESLRRIPALNFLLAETRDELSGSLGAVRQADAYGRTMMGAAWMLWAYSMARNGLLTGAGPSDQKDMQFWLQDHQPYSMKVGDKWVNYSRYDLPGALLAIPAVLYDRTVNRTSDVDWNTAMLAGVGSLAQYFKDKAALQGMASLMDFGASPAQSISIGERTAGQVAAKMFVPNFVTQLGRNVQDPTKRFKTSIGDYIADALPWASQELDPMRNVLGEPLHKPQNTFIEGAIPLTITPVVSSKNDPVMSELDRLYEASGYAPGVTSPSAISGGSPLNGYYDPREVKLEDGRSLFDAVIRQRLAPSDNYGKSLRDSLGELFASEDYKQAVDGDAVSAVDTLGRVSRAALVRRIFSDFQREAIRRVAQESPIARRYLAVSDAKRVNGDLLRPYSAERLVETPKLMDAMGIDIKQFEENLQ